MWDWIINKLGCCSTCADCKHINKCWNKIDDDILNTPECKDFDERDK